MDKNIFDFSKVSELCIKCGKCIPTCTIHQVNPDEVTSPRGFLELLGAYQNGQLELDKNVKSIFESCFLCTHCTDICPNSLPVDMVIEQVRNDIRKKYLLTALNISKGNKKKAAKSLGISYRTYNYQLEKLIENSD